MRKLFVLVFIVLSALVKAQPVDSIRKYWLENDLARAKEMVDVFVAENPEDAQAWLLKAGIYNTISNDNDYKDLSADARQESFTAIKMADQVNPAWLQEQLQKDNYRLIFDLYKGYTNEGVAFFNAGVEKQNKDDFAKSVPLFKKADAIGKFIYGHGWGLSVIDSNNLYYTAKAAIYAERKDEALLFTKRIADANITLSPDHYSFEQFYQWLVYYCRSKNEVENLDKYTAVGTQLFPTSTYFELNYIDWLREGKNYPAMFSLYKKVFKRGLVPPGYRLSYCRDMFNFVFEAKDSIPARKGISMLLEKELLNYSKKYPVDVTAKLLLGKFYSYEAAGLQYEIAKMTAAKKKARLATYQARIVADLKKSIPVLKDIADHYPQTGKEIYNESLQLLIQNLTALKKGPEVAKYQARFKP